MNEPVQQTLSPTTQMLLQQAWNNIDAVIQAWSEASKQLELAKQQEMNLRKAVFELKFPGHAEGTARTPLANGYNLKAVGKLNYILDKDKTEAAQYELSNAGNEGAFIADRLVKWTPELSISEYRKLAPQYKTIIDKVLTVKPGAPTLEIEAPKQV